MNAFGQPIPTRRLDLKTRYQSMMDIARRVAHPHLVEPRPERTASENDLTVRLKHAEEALRAHKLSFQLIVESIPAPVAVITPTGQVEALNQPVLDYFGKSFEELTGWVNSDPVHPDDLPHVTEVMRKALERGETYEVESRHRRADGVYRWFHVRGFPLKDTDGRILRWCVLLTDIDDRKRAEAQLAGEKRLLEMVASSCALTDVLTALCKFVEDTSADCHCGVYLIDWSGPKFRIGAVPSLPATFNDPVDGLTVSPHAGPCGLAALTKTQVIATDLESDPLWQSCAIRPLALAHGIRSQWSTPIYARDGRVMGTFAIFQRSPASPTQLQQDLIAQVTHIASIAIERAVSEAALKQSEAFLAEAQHLSRIGSFAWHMATNEITWSEQLYRVFEFDPHVRVTLELIGTRVHPEDLTLFHDMIERASSSATDFQYEHRLLMPDHSIKYLHLIAHGTRNEDGELEYIGAAQDVTQWRLSEEALGNARAELAHVTRVMSLGALTASIAHEVNQPLSGIITNASTCLRMLDADPPNVDGARETARRTIRDGHRASDVITRLRALFSRKDMATELVDLNEATREVMALALCELQRNRVIVKSELADELPIVAGDRVQIQQVILNLLRNASEAMSGVGDRPRHLLIRTELGADGGVRLSVRDAGIGFAPESMNKLFDSFYTTKSDGMGIGLSVSRSIIENHQGRLWATSNDGPGATFSFSIPCVTEGVGTAGIALTDQKRAARPS
jgi:PAS domain S-box-containing protein